MVHLGTKNYWLPFCSPVSSGICPSTSILPPPRFPRIPPQSTRRTSTRHNSKHIEGVPQQPNPPRVPFAFPSRSTREPRFYPLPGLAASSWADSSPASDEKPVDLSYVQKENPWKIPTPTVLACTTYIVTIVRNIYGQQIRHTRITPTRIFQGRSLEARSSIVVGARASPCSS